MATVQRYVNTASTAGGDGTTNATSGASRAYASLSEWEAASGGSATDDYIVDCCGSAADTTAVTVDFATNITTGSITIRGNRNDNAGFYNGPLAISMNHYRLVVGAGASALYLNESNCTVDGIQVESGGGSFRAGINVAGAPNVTVKNCRVRATATTQTGIGTAGVDAAGSNTKTFENNLVVGFDNGIDLQIASHYSPTVIIQQNTIYGDGSAVGIRFLEQAGSGASAVTIKGNAIGNSGASNCFSVTFNGSGSATYDDNATEDAQGTSGEIAIGTLTNAWTSPGTGQSADFTVKDTSSTLYAAVNPTLVTYDITGYTRDGTSHDVGCFEYQSAVTASKQLMTLGVGD